MPIGENHPSDIPSQRRILFHVWQILAALFALLAGCSDQDQLNQQPPPARVKVVYPIKREVDEWQAFTGRIEAVEAVEVRARVSGYLEKIHFVDGQKVGKGDPLFSIDPEPFKAQLDLARAELERAKYRRELAQLDLKRAERLLQTKTISQGDYDNRKTTFLEADATVHAAEAAVYAARLNLQYCDIRSPITGRVGREQITEGNLVNGGNEATLLTTIVSTDPVYVYADADERSILRFKRSIGGRLEGIEAQVGVADEDGFPHVGRLDFIAPVADFGTGTVKLRGVFDNPKELLSPGFFARMRIKVSPSYSALMVPERALGSDQAQRFVWVLDADDRAEYRHVVTGALIDDLRVVKEGLGERDRVVVEGLQKVRPGEKVVAEFDPSAGDR